MKRIAPLLTTSLLTACAISLSVAGTAQAAAEARTIAVPEKNPALAKFFDDVDRADLAESPFLKTARGIRDQDYGKWDDYSEQADVAHEQRL